MEKRLLLAIVLSFLVLFLWQAVFFKKEPPPEPISKPTMEIEQKSEASSLQKEGVTSPETIKSAEKIDFQPVYEQIEKQIVVDTSLYRAVWSNKGALLRSWKFKEFKDEDKEDLELISAHSEEIDKYPFLLSTGDSFFDNVINKAFYKSSRKTLDLKEGRREELHFQYADGKGNRVEKTFTFKDGKYDVDINIEVWRNSQKIEPNIIWGPSIGNPSAVTQKQRFGRTRGISVYSGKKVLHQEERKYNVDNPGENTHYHIQWVGYEDQYFTALFLTSPQEGSATFLREEKNQVPYFFLSVSSTEKAFIGPKQFDTLNTFGHETKKIIRFGLFGFIAEILYKAIKSTHKVFPNWGFCIIILTIIIKIICFPLTYSSTKSMAKMQEIQPKIKALRAKYKKAKQDIGQRRKMNEEMMKIYKEHGINPAGGCLPMLIQLPIFWGFFRLLVIAVEFRQSPFIFWIKDLSIKDPYYVTPILMGITQFISQKMTPTSAEPTQQKMMLIMPVIMTIFFMNFQSGLVLYWLTNNVLQIGQQYIMNRYLHKKKRVSHGKKRKK